MDNSTGADTRYDNKMFQQTNQRIKETDQNLHGHLTPLGKRRPFIVVPLDNPDIRTKAFFDTLEEATRGAQLLAAHGYPYYVLKIVSKTTVTPPVQQCTTTVVFEG